LDGRYPIKLPTQIREEPLFLAGLHHPS
jgi:hypothetical protein